MDMHPSICDLCNAIVRLTSPLKIILFSKKASPDGNLSSVKLCVIVPENNSRQVERDIYVHVVSELSFDVLVYTKEEWERMLSIRFSLAERILNTGSVLYEAE